MPFILAPKTKYRAKGVVTFPATVPTERWQSAVESMYPDDSDFAFDIDFQGGTISAWALKPVPQQKKLAVVDPPATVGESPADEVTS